MPGAPGRDRGGARVRQPVARRIAEGLRGGRGARAPLRALPRGGGAAHRSAGQGRERHDDHTAVRRPERRGALMAFDLAAYVETRRTLVDEALERVLPPETAAPPTLHRAMRYSVRAGGKRLRPILVIAGAEAVGGSAE